MNRTLLTIALLAAFAGGCSSSLMAGAKGEALDDAGPSAVSAEAKSEAGGAGTDIQSGILTAGSFDDNVEIEVFRDFAKSMGQHQDYGPLAERLTGRRIVLTVRDREGRPVGNARVTIGETLHVTRTDGRAIVVPEWDGLHGNGPLTALVRSPAGETTATIPADADAFEIPIPGEEGELPKTLDLALVIDVTGSMGDEIAYLKQEIKSIANTVRHRFPEVEQQFALVVYRDEGDEFVSEVHDFMPRIEDFQSRLASHSADGGGDYPEAMHVALEKADGLEWRGGNTASVLFLVADAPPHDEFAVRTLETVDALRRRGVAVYPVAASGVAEECELVMRTAALLTGALYLFLTDNSGVGLPHAEPHIPYYDVERLDRLMVRMIASELAGERLAATPREIIRSVDHREQAPSE